MKIGIDINNNEISRDILEQLKNKGHYVIDMSIVNSKNIGNRLHEKSILANSSKIDFYINLSMVQLSDKAEVYCKNKEEAKRFCLLFLKQLIEYESKEIRFGEDLYLIKNIMAPSVIVLLGGKNKNLNNKKIARYIASSILNEV